MHFMEKNCHKTKSPHSGLFAFSISVVYIIMPDPLPHDIRFPSAFESFGESARQAA